MDMTHKKKEICICMRALIANHRGRICERLFMKFINPPIEVARAAGSTFDQTNVFKSEPSEM